MNEEPLIELALGAGLGCCCLCGWEGFCGTPFLAHSHPEFGDAGGYLAATLLEFARGTATDRFEGYRLFRQIFDAYPA